MRFEVLEQTLRLRLVSGPVDKKFFFLMGNRLSRTALVLNLGTSQYTLNVSQIRPFIENEESFRKFCHGGTTRLRDK